MYSAFIQMRFVVGPVARIVFLEVEDRTRAVDAFERELFDQLVERIDLSFLAGRPAQQREKIAKRGGDKTGVAIGRQRYDLAVVSFGELSLARREYQRQVREFRRRDAERLVDQDLLVRVGQMVLAADDVA